MGKITFILGGARSGKSTYALSLAGGYKEVAFLATAQARDSEMHKRIAAHQKKRPVHWQTFEEPLDVSGAIEKIPAKFGLIIIDCLTLLISNLLLKGLNEGEIEKNIKHILKAIKESKAKSIIVSNEVGLGIVPQNKLGRRFRDVAGKINQQVASGADEVILMVSGVPLVLKKK